MKELTCCSGIQHHDLLPTSGMTIPRKNNKKPEGSRLRVFCCKEGVAPIIYFYFSGELLITSPLGPFTFIENTLLPSRQWVAQEIQGS